MMEAARANRKINPWLCPTTIATPAACTAAIIAGNPPALIAIGSPPAHAARARRRSPRAGGAKLVRRRHIYPCTAGSPHIASTVS